MNSWGYDITFCVNKQCDKTDCKRHHSKMPIGVPITVSDLSGDNCLYWSENEEE